MGAPILMIPPSVSRSKVMALCRDILRRHAITPFNVVGHSDIAWRRKQDPGPLFSWPQAAPILRGMAQLGYNVTPDMPQALQRRALRAFQMHYRPRDYRGLPNSETDAVLRPLLEINTVRRGGD
nr:N-acetylmuramoyl-L-alanine amidase [Sodalis glossinidius]